MLFDESSGKLKKQILFHLRLPWFQFPWITLIHRLSQAQKRSSHFFSRTSQGHNAFPWPGVEPGSSDSEPSALTTGLLDKAVALACPQYSWPRMLKVAPYTVVRSYNQISSAWWVTTILYNYGATLCELRYYFTKQKIERSWYMSYWSNTNEIERFSFVWKTN